MGQQQSAPSRGGQMRGGQMRGGLMRGGLMRGGQMRTQTNAQYVDDRKHRSIAEANAEAGWPGFMTKEDVYSQMYKFKTQKSLMGYRIRFVDRDGTCIEYVKLRRADADRFYQRVDAPCGSMGSVPKFPHALAGDELPRGTHMPYAVTVKNEGYCEIRDSRNGKCASYQLVQGGLWVKTEERCRHTVHDEAVKKQVARLEAKLQRRGISVSGFRRRAGAV